MIVRAISMLMRLIYVDSCKTIFFLQFLTLFSSASQWKLSFSHWGGTLMRPKAKRSFRTAWYMYIRPGPTRLSCVAVQLHGPETGVLWHSWPVPPRSYKSNINMVVRWVCLKHELASKDKAPCLCVQWPWHLLLGNLKSPWVTHI